jgi:exportin-5
MSYLGDVLYRFEELPVPLSKALFAGAGPLSTHQTGIIIDMIRPIIEHCPPDARAHFLSPIVTAMFTHLDFKVGIEWEKIEERNKAAAVDDDLMEEMKDESILRQLTYNCVTTVARLLDPSQSK